MPHGTIACSWRAPFTNREIHRLHAAAFETRLFDESEWDWVDQTDRHSLGWVVARDDQRFIGFPIVPLDTSKLRRRDGEVGLAFRVSEAGRPEQLRARRT